MPSVRWLSDADERAHPTVIQEKVHSAAPFVHVNGVIHETVGKYIYNPRHGCASLVYAVKRPQILILACSIELKIAPLPTLININQSKVIT